MRFPAVAVVLGLVGVTATVASCGDLFHGTHWETLCDHDASANGCEKTGASSSANSSGVGGTGGTGGAGGTSSGGGGSGGDPCGPYCSEVVNACVTDAPQYESIDSCLHVCAIVPHENVPKANDIPCRQMFADEVSTNTTLCPAAGPGGGGKCGPICDAYCNIMSKRCMQFVGTSAVCGKQCKTYDNSVPYSTSVQSGNNLACRLYWAIESVDDATKCANAAQDSPMCVDSEG